MLESLGISGVYALHQTATIYSTLKELHEPMKRSPCKHNTLSLDHTMYRPGSEYHSYSISTVSVRQQQPREERFGHSPTRRPSDAWLEHGLEHGLGFSGLSLGSKDLGGSEKQRNR